MGIEILKEQYFMEKFFNFLIVFLFIQLHKIVDPAN